MPKRTLDAAIFADVQAAANDSFKDSIKMIELTKLKPSKNNFYSMSDLDLLADDIERQGLKHNLVVVPSEDNPNEYRIISGHRRFAAIQLLTEQGRYHSKYVPCFISGSKNAAETMLDLIMLNATTRRMSDAEYVEQYEYLEETLRELDAAGATVGGRMRERIAEKLKVSPAQVGKIENVLRNGIEEVQQAVRDGEMSISTASAVASLPAEEQKALTSDKPISKIKTKDAKERQKPQKSEIKSEVAPIDSSFSDETDEIADENFVSDTEFEDTEMFDDVSPKDPLEFMGALDIAMKIATDLKSGLHSTLDFQKLESEINKSISELQNLKGMIEKCQK